MSEGERFVYWSPYRRPTTFVRLDWRGRREHAREERRWIEGDDWFPFARNCHATQVW